MYHTTYGGWKWCPYNVDDGTPQIYFDKMSAIHQHLHELAMTTAHVPVERNRHQSLFMEQVHYLHGILEDIWPTTKTDLQAQAHKAAVNELRRSDLIKSGDWR